MGRKRLIGGGDKPAKRKKVTVRIIKEKHGGEITEPHRLLTEIRNAEHGHLAEAKIGLAWRTGWRSDTDGHTKMGQCRKSSDLDREMYAGFDFVILLNEEAWKGLNEAQKRALIDHELCHAALSMDANGEPKYNDRDRLCCRVKKHDVEEFRCIVERHGLYTQDLAALAEAAINDSQRPLLAVAEKAEAAATANGNGKSKSAWRNWPTSCLLECGLPAGKLKLLEENGLDTMGKLMDRMNRAGAEDFWWKDIKGFGEGGYDAMVNSIMALRKGKSDFQADEQCNPATAPESATAATTDGDDSGDDASDNGDMETKILSMSNAGTGMKKIAEEVGVSERTVRKVLGKL
jgi:hypothetical protein